MTARKRRYSVPSRRSIWKWQYFNHQAKLALEYLCRDGETSKGQINETDEGTHNTTHWWPNVQWNLWAKVDPE